MSSARNKRRLNKKKRKGQIAVVDPLTEKLALAQQHHAAGHLYEAEHIYRAILAQNPNHPQTLNLLGQLAMQAEQFTIAVGIYRRVIKVERANPDSYYCLGVALQRVGDSQESEAMLREANKHNKNNPAILNALGLAISYQGRFDEALRFFRHAINVSPNYIPAYYSLSISKKFTIEDDDLELFEKLYNYRHELVDNNIPLLCFAMGKVCDDLACYDVAFEAFNEGNQLVRKQRHFDICDFEKNYDRLKKYFTENNESEPVGSGYSQESPIFVLGMPRSGTTLVENILYNHPEASSIGESALLRDTLDQLPQILGLQNTDNVQNFYELLDSVTENALQEAGKFYVENMKKGLNGERVRIVDKTPLNFLMIGFILQMLPNAIIIHCVRNPMDTCLSIFQQYFANGHDYAYNLTEIGQFYNLYQRYMKLWDNRFPSKIIKINYELLVADTENETRRLLAACHLPWEEHCLTRENTGKSSNTASKLQVRQPIYKSSVDRWRRYEKHLTPLVSTLKH